MSATGSQPAVSIPEENPVLLQLDDVDAGYGTTQVLRNLSITVPPASVVVLLGANGAGKTTTLRVASGLLKPSRGTVRLDGVDVSGMASYKLARRGLCLIPEGRAIFRSLTVRDNLELHVRSGAAEPDAVAKACEVFPALASRLNQTAGSMSGGEQQMLALSRAYLSSPRIILLDEVSMGLAPLVVSQIFDSVRALAATGVSLLLVEQYVEQALAFADTAYLMSRGGITWSGPADQLDREAVSEAYLNVVSAGDA